MAYNEFDPAIVHQKKKLRSWLLERLDVNDCPGCSWLDTERKWFRLSWKHYGRPGFDEKRDATIFRKWAEHTGRYSHGDPPDVSTWKTRFRNALHKMPDIEELTNYHRLDGNDPYRVYRFRTQEELVIYREKIKPNGVEFHDNELERINQIAASLKNDSEQSAATAQPQCQPMYDCNRNDQVMPPFDDDELDLIEKIILEKMANDQANTTTVPAPMPQLIQIQHDQTNSYLSAIMSANSNIPLTAVGVKLFFSDKEVQCKIINNLNGFRISYEPPSVSQDMVQEPDTKNILSNIFGPLDAEQVYYPDSDDHNTQNILKKSQRGVVIIAHPNGDIVATRLSQSRVFYSDTATNTPQKLIRSKETLIYSFEKDFLPQLQNYQCQMTAPPSCERYFSIGQSWSEKEPLREMLINFSVTHFFAKKVFKEVKAQKPFEVENSITNSLDHLQRELEMMALRSPRQ